MSQQIMGNTFTTKSWSIGKGERVWREIRHRLPAGGTIVNLGQFTTLGKIPAGTALVFNDADYTINAITGTAYSTTAKYAVGDTVVNSNKLYVCKTAITEGESFTSSKWTEIKAISGLQQDDIVINENTTAATGTVVYAGEVYSYMYDAKLLALLKSYAPAELHFVN